MSFRQLNTKAAYTLGHRKNLSIDLDKLKKAKQKVFASH